MSLVETNTNLRAGKYATFLQVAFDNLHGDSIDAASQDAMALNYTWEKFSLYKVCVIE
jgi:hypothetical protein